MSMAAPSLRSEKKTNPRARCRKAWTPRQPPVDGQLSEADGKAEENDDETEEYKAETHAYWQIAGEADIAKLLGVPCFDERTTKPSVGWRKCSSRNPSALWFSYMVKWMKEHKAFWAKRLHAGDRAIHQLAKHIESGACCRQFDVFLALKNPDALKPSKYVNELPSKFRCARNLNMTHGLNL